MYQFMRMLEHTVRTTLNGNIEHSKYRTMICTGSRNDSGMGMSFTWHGSGMERVWNGVWNEMDPSLQKCAACLVFLTTRNERVMVWYGTVNQDD